jgi:hypothetical protein
MLAPPRRALRQQVIPVAKRQRWRRARLVPVNANASVPSRAAPSFANLMPRYADTTSNNHTRATALTDLRDGGFRLLNRRERHCLYGRSQR